MYDEEIMDIVRKLREDGCPDRINDEDLAWIVEQTLANAHLAPNYTDILST